MKSYIALICLGLVSCQEKQPLVSSLEATDGAKVCTIADGAIVKVYQKASKDSLLDYGVGSGSAGSPVKLYIEQEDDEFYRVNVRGPSSFASKGLQYVLKADPSLKCQQASRFDWQLIKRIESGKPKISAKVAKDLEGEAAVFFGDGVYRCQGEARTFDDKKEKYFDFYVTGRFGTEDGRYKELAGKIVTSNLRIDFADNAKTINLPLNFYRSRLVNLWSAVVPEGKATVDLELDQGSLKAALKLPNSIDKRGKFVNTVMSSSCQFNRFSGDLAPIVTKEESDILVRYSARFKVPFFCSGKKEDYRYKVFGARTLYSVHTSPAPMIQVYGWQDRVVFKDELTERKKLFKAKKTFFVKPSFPAIEFSLGGAKKKGVIGTVNLEHVVSDTSEFKGTRRVTMDCF